MFSGNIGNRHPASSSGPTVFRELWNFEPSRGTCIFPWNFDISVEFCRIFCRSWEM